MNETVRVAQRYFDEGSLSQREIRSCSMSEGFIPLSVPNLKGKELEYVTEAVRSEWVSTAGS